MGMDIMSARNHAIVGMYSTRLWHKLLGIATAYGWQPAGTILGKAYIRGKDRICPAVDELRREFDADPGTRSLFQTFEAYRQFCRGGGIVESDNWNGGYGSNDGQFVTPEDARNLSLALSRALDDDLSRQATMARPNDSRAMSAMRK